MRFKWLLMAGLLGLSACSGDDNKAVDCSAEPEPGVVDCRSENDSSGNGSGQLDGDNGETVDFTRDPNAVLDLVAVGADTWTRTHADQIDTVLSAQGSALLVGSRYHNYLRGFQTDAAGQLVALDAQAYLQVEGDRYAIDGVTGASEQVLSALWPVNEGGQLRLYSQAQKYSGDSASTGVGLYVSDVFGLDALPEQLFGQADASQYIAYGAIQATAVSADGRLVAIGGSDRALRLYDTDDLSTPLASVTLDMTVRALAFSDDGATLYVGGATIVGQVAALQTSSLAEIWRYESDRTPRKVLATASGVLALMPVGQTLLYILPQDGADPAVVEVELPELSVNMALNADGDRLAVAGFDKTIELISLATGSRATVKLEKSPSGIAFDEHGTLWALSAQTLSGFTAPAGFN